MVIRNLELVHHDGSSVTMETGKPGLASTPMHISSVARQVENRMDTQAPLTAVYIHTLPALQAQPYHQPPPPSVCEPATLHLAVPPIYSKETIPFLTLHIAGELQCQPGLSTAGAVTPSARPKSAGKYVCPHCGRDCMKPSVLEKHLRCHTGERPYPCTTCGVSFKTQSNLYKHRRTQAHARLSSESEQSSVGSLDNSSRDACPSSLSLDERSEESDSMDKDPGLPVTESMRIKSLSAFFPQGSVGEQTDPNLSGHNRERNEIKNTMNDGEKHNLDSGKPALTVSRHLPTLQRQEATLFSKQWQSCLSRGKSQSHESTDSGFSESSDHYLSPSSVLPERSQGSPSEPTTETLEPTPCVETGSDGAETKDTARKQEQKSLEERISKLISENTAVVEDKQLENIRPRKTILSKQGSIDLPVPYTYKDSFHFEMKNSQTFGSNFKNRPAMYCSVPTQCSSTAEHAPLTRSNSLPFSVTLLQPEKSSLASPGHNDYVTLVRRGSSGQINPAAFTIRPANQHSSSHHPLVRQTAVDCNHATDALPTNSSVDEASGSFSCDLDTADICGEPSNRKFRRKKAQKFAYNKWYMYGGGTFKKLYSPEKSSENSVIKGRKCSTNPGHDGLKRLTTAQKETGTGSGSVVNSPKSISPLGSLDVAATSLPIVSALDLNQQTRTVMAPLRRNLSLSVLPSLSVGLPVSHKTDSVNRTEAGRLIQEHSGLTSQLPTPHIPSNRKKQRTDCEITCALKVDSNPITLTHSPPPVPDSASQSQHSTTVPYINIDKNSKVPGISSSSAVSNTSPAHCSFLPKYQLKLPNTVEAASTPPAPLSDKRMEHFTCTVSASQSEPASIALSTPSYGPSTFSPVTMTHHQSLLLCKVTTLCQNRTSSLAVTHRQFASATKTTSCLQSHQAGLCSTSVQSKTATGTYAPMHVSPLAMQISPHAAVTTPTAGPTTPPAGLTLTTANSQTPVSSHPPALSSNPLSTESDHLISAHRPAGPNSPAVRCHIVPPDRAQPSPQRVYHVHTADLQICLQIISDEQLALIEPQIERPLGSGLSQQLTENVGNQVQSSVTTDITVDPRHGQKQMDNSEHLLRKTPPLSVHFGKPNLHLAEGSVSNGAAVSAPSIPLEALSPLLHPHDYALVNMETGSSEGDIMSTDASSGGVKSERSQTSEETRAFSLNCCSDKQVRHEVSGSASCQHKVHGRTLSPSSVCQSNIKITKTEQLDKEFLRPESEGETLQTTGEDLASRNINLGGGERPSHVPGGEELPACSNALEITFSEPPFKQKNLPCDKVGPLNDLLFESQEVICPVFSEKRQSTFESSHMEKPKDVLDVQSTPHSTNTGLLEGATTRLRQTADRCQNRNQAAPGREGGLPCELVGQGKTGGTVKDHQRPRCDTQSDCRSPQETMAADRDVITNSWLPQQHLLSQTGSGMSVASATVRSPPKTFTYPQHQDHSAQSQVLHHHQPAEGLRPPQSCQDLSQSLSQDLNQDMSQDLNPNLRQDLSQDLNQNLNQDLSQDSSSSDDEGKLIIEL